MSIKLQFGVIRVTELCGLECATISAPSAQWHVWLKGRCVVPVCLQKGLLVGVRPFLQLDFFQLVLAAAKPQGFTIGQLHRARSVGPAGGKFVCYISAWRGR